ncbi:MAG: integrase core domain-containing protein [Treponema sp.]|nr:integrase core domain-containing protein [Treponema sp.]
MSSGAVGAASAGRTEYEPEGEPLGQCLYGAFFKALKAEADKVEERRTKEEVRVAVCEYREPYYNTRRRHSALGYAIPTALTPCNTAYPTVHLIEGIPTLPREGKTLPR